MKRSWASTPLGELFTKSRPWTLTLDGESVTFELDGKSHVSSIGSAVSLVIEKGRFWSSVSYKPDGIAPIFVDGIPNGQAADMSVHIRNARIEFYADEVRRKEIFKQVDEFLATVVRWSKFVGSSVARHKQQHRWLSRDTLGDWSTARPSLPLNFSLAHVLQEPRVKQYYDGKGTEEHAAVKLWNTDLNQLVVQLNEHHLQTELSECAEFLDQVEKSKLTPDQALAVLCFENRVLTIASAGSGKTSTMVAKAGYAVHRGHVQPERILLLAFNTEAAKELQERIVERLGKFNIPADKIRAQTFHAFGLSVIGTAAGKKPRLAPWLDQGKDLEHMSELIDSLKDNDPHFRTSWDLFRVVFSRDLPKFGSEEEAPEDYDRDTKKSGFRTLDGRVVKSHGERLIADWLYYNGVNFSYEPRYVVDTADATHGAYQPDFFYCDVNLYHEHFALNEKGEAPPEFKGYAEGVKWKRELHAKHKTQLVETTSADLRSGKAFRILEDALTRRGIILDPNPDRPVVGRKVIEHHELVKVFRTFLTHVKGNLLSDADLRVRLRATHVGAFIYRHEMFLDLFKKIRAAWEASLTQGDCIDFDDMLNIAADHIEGGRYDSPYDLVMVDEFQDASKARARLASALVKKPHKFLFAVGDDWQGINRFAGADISVMTDFDRWFGKGKTVRLERTFRCPQSLCDISSRFVQKNPVQIPKKVTSTNAEFPPAVRGLQVKDDKKILPAIDKFLGELCISIATGDVPINSKGKVSVFLLGRYRKEAEFLPYELVQKYKHYLDLTFKTVHSSKGLEADYIILPRMVRGAYSFPSTIQDDPVLQLAMPSGDTFPFAEERRLFYVALTRARRQVVMVTVEGRLSPFVTELVLDSNVKLADVDGNPAEDNICPKCQVGSLIKKPGQYGPYFDCNNFPACKYRISQKKRLIEQSQKR
ncbi:UvrD-helicase domain-containing protein [Massilia sp. YIM B02763]|uniref:UvrD-helicase domain-containing protein n=1 Tax=Massilia sp. YIM B02763 TaxID=3050130 RepID=UPI0025B6B493|nr:UvrD-helicase domain-containing protein [Massilia sp. YIM B02763]MDN4053135.1 UvrD-helicase domain-containing protein [Massilia sp. YIM B02763]